MNPATRTREETVAAFNHITNDIEGFLNELSAEDFRTPSLCPGWDVRECTTHAVGIEHLLAGWVPSSVDDAPPFDKMGDFAAEAVALSEVEFLSRVGQVLRGRRKELAEATDVDFARPSFMPTGPGTYGRFMALRVFDLWVHHRDMTVPLGRATADGGIAAEIALDEVHGALGYIVGKKIGLPDGMSMAFRVRGAVERDIFVAVDGRASLVDTLESPTVEITADSTSFVLLACGRIDPAAEVGAGNVRWSGDDEWGERAAHNLRFTM
jgi:uncharacterized protein (TIGR03083 family)